MLRHETPCSQDGICPYSAEYSYTCATYCSVGEPEYEEDYEDDEYEDEEYDWDDEPDVDECGFDPYEGCYTYDC